MTTRNGAVLLGQNLGESERACIELLEETLELAAEGKIMSVAIVACMPDGIATVMAGKHAGDLNLGCDDLKRKIYRAIFEDGNVAPRSRIVRAG